MAVALSLPMGLALLLDNVERLGGSWQRAAQISLFMQLDVDAATGERLRDQVAGMPDVAEADWISREQALEEFQQLSGLGEALKELPENPLPGVILVTPDEVDKDKLEALRQQLAELPGVQQAQLDLLWVERLTAILKLGDRFVFGLTLLLVATLLLVIGNTIRLHIENRRTEIEVVKLVGGTDGYVRRPFLYMGHLRPRCGTDRLAAAGIRPRLAERGGGQSGRPVRQRFRPGGRAGRRCAVAGDRCGAPWLHRPGWLSHGTSASSRQGKSPLIQSISGCAGNFSTGLQSHAAMLNCCSFVIGGTA